jgi:hypothetical protein
MPHEVVFPYVVMAGLLSICGFGVKFFNGLGYDHKRPIQKKPFEEALVKRDKNLQYFKFQRDRADQAGFLETMRARDPYL